MRFTPSRYLLLFLLLFSLQFGIVAQQPYAAVLEVIYPGVEIQLFGTSNWLPLAAGAQAPLTTGDKLRTDQDGRALIQYADAAQTLVLPRTEFEVSRFEQKDDTGLIIDTHLSTGRSIQRLLPTGTTAIFELNTLLMTITHPTAIFAAQADDDGSNAVIVAEGSALVTGTESEVTLRSGEGLTAAPTLGEVIHLKTPYRFSYLSVTADVCMGDVQATLPNTDSVFVRVGPGEDFRGLGQIPNGEKIAILGKTEAGKRYLTPFLSGFGWVIDNGIILQNCRDLPTLPAVAQTVTSVRNVQPRELEFLQPFFGSPEEDKWFYIYD
ncbi:MAG: hypothetical protein R3E39_19105 [Anaerolineae bacterium]